MINDLVYPIYHLDFETFATAVPVFDGSRPYQQLVFQYSLHIEHQNGDLEHKEYLAEADVPSRLLAVYMLPESSKDLKDKSKKSLKNIIQMCTHLPALEPLLQLAPNNILTYVTA